MSVKCLLIMQTLIVQTAIPIFIGTKFDDFIQLPIDLQWTIASQVNWYSKIIFVTILVKA